MLQAEQAAEKIFHRLKRLLKNGHGPLPMVAVLHRLKPVPPAEQDFFGML
jgi:hypothetical protein